MKLRKNVIEHKLMQNVKKLEKQVGLMLRRSMIEAIHLLHQLIERFRERRQNLRMVFIDLEKSL